MTINRIVQSESYIRFYDDNLLVGEEDQNLVAELYLEEKSKKIWVKYPKNILLPERVHWSEDRTFEITFHPSGSTKSIPVGSIIAWGGSITNIGQSQTNASGVLKFPNGTLPQDFAICDGSWLSAEKYPALRSLLQEKYNTTTSDTTRVYLPNYKNLFLRSYDATGVNDPDRLIADVPSDIGNIQSAEIKSHSHRINNAHMQLEDNKTDWDDRVPYYGDSSDPNSNNESTNYAGVGAMLPKHYLAYFLIRIRNPIIEKLI